MSRAVELDDYPLLNIPNLIAVLLRAAERSAPTVGECAELVLRRLAEAGEAVPVPAARIAARLETLARHLAVAGLVEEVPGGRFRLTGRGRAALAAHPAGFALDDLAVYPEYAAHLAARPQARPADQRAGGYDQGFAAFAAGRPLAANPHPPDSADHLAWENGWSEASDERDRRAYQVDTPPN